MSKNRVWYPRCSRTGKIRYPTEEAAERARSYFAKKGADPSLNIYLCKRCEDFHLGSRYKSMERINGK